MQTPPEYWAGMLDAIATEIQGVWPTVRVRCRSDLHPLTIERLRQLGNVSHRSRGPHIALSQASIFIDIDAGLFSQIAEHMSAKIHLVSPSLRRV